LLDDALLFNPWVSKEHPPEEIPQDIRQQIMEKRKQWEENGANNNPRPGS
jgi:hypothetical protein